MEYIFRTDQIEILNHLVFDANINLENIEKLKLVDSSVGFEIERRTFENVTRKKKFFWTLTYLCGEKSFIRFENVDQLVVSVMDDKHKHNHFINRISIDSSGKLMIESVTDLNISMKVSEITRIYLTHIKESKFGNGIVGGKVGFTKDEWTTYLNDKNYLLYTNDKNIRNESQQCLYQRLNAIGRTVVRRKIVHLLKILLAGKRYFQNCQLGRHLQRHLQRQGLLFLQRH